MSDDIDFYFDKNYGKLYEIIDNGQARVFEYEDENGKISSQFLLREVPFQIDDVTYFDITTPYGYGGPVVHYATDRKKLVENYEKRFCEYCLQNNIISEFVRFHPIEKNYEDFDEMYDIKFMRKTLGTSLKWDDPIMKEFSKNCRKKIRRILKNNVHFEIEQKPDSLTEFKRIYDSTMKRKHANEYYFFEDSYYEDILKYFKDQVALAKAYLGDKLIACGLYFLSGKTIHAHLSGTDTDYLKYSPAYILKYGTALWGKEHGYELIHYGGGLSNSEEDSLYKFKRRFAEKTDFDFYIGKRIWNRDIYDKLCEIARIGTDTDFFPAYRAGTK